MQFGSREKVHHSAERTSIVRKGSSIPISVHWSHAATGARALLDSHSGVTYNCYFDAGFQAHAASDENHGTEACQRCSDIKVDQPLLQRNSLTARIKPHEADGK